MKPTPEQLADDGRIDGVRVVSIGAARDDTPREREARIEAYAAQVQAHFAAQRAKAREKALPMLMSGKCRLPWQRLHEILTPAEIRERARAMDRRAYRRHADLIGTPRAVKYPRVHASDGREWPSAKAAARELGVSPTSVREAIRNKWRCRGLLMWPEGGDRPVIPKPRGRRRKRGRRERALVRDDGAVFASMHAVVGLDRTDPKYRGRRRVLENAIRSGRPFEGHVYKRVTTEVADGQQQHQDRPDGSRPDRAAGDLALRVA